MNVNFNDETTIWYFLKQKSADNYVSRHDIAIFGKWYIEMVHYALRHFQSETCLKYVFLYSLFTPNKNNNHKRFILDNSFWNLSKDGNSGFKWKTFGIHLNFKSSKKNDRKDMLSSFVKLLEKQAHKLKERQSNKSSNSDLTVVDPNFVRVKDKINEIKQILPTLNQRDHEQALQLMMNLTSTNPDQENTRKRMRDNTNNKESIISSKRRKIPVISDNHTNNNGSDAFDEEPGSGFEADLMGQLYAQKMMIEFQLESMRYE